MQCVRLILCNRKYDPELPYQYIGRPSPLQNPFPMVNQSIRERNRVCDEFLVYFHGALPALEHELNDLLSLAVDYGVLQLVCFCSPCRCHGDTIIVYLKAQLLKHGYDVVVERNEN